MPRKRQPLMGDPNDPQSMIAMIKPFLEWLRIRNYSDNTVNTREMDLGYFINWAAARGVTCPTEVTKPIIERYQRFLYHYRKHDGGPLSFQSQLGRIASIRVWFRWMSRNNHILYNPAADIDLPRAEFRLPTHILTATEAEQVINQPNVSTRSGLRDRAILETFYSTGIRRTELVYLCTDDIDVGRGAVVIRQGKGKKDRIVPIGERALAWINRYTIEVRPGLLVGDRAANYLFLTNMGKQFSPDQMSHLVRCYVRDSGIGKAGACHMFRHTMATLMLENGASIRYIQAILGHERLDTTQIYTRVSIRKLKEVHTATHPAHKHRHDGHQP
jgi:integrase/recombinase XerD